MTFDIDRTTVTEGDVVEVRWDCTGADRVELSIDNGYKASVLPLETAGTKRFRLNRSKGRTKLTITAWKGGKHGSKTLKVRVRELQTTRTETVDEQGRHVNSAKEWWQRTQPKWQAMPPEKRLASRIGLILAGVLLVGIVVPRLFLIGLLALMGYLIYVVCKR